MIIIVVPDITNNFYASVIKGALTVCRKQSYSVVVCNSDENTALETGDGKTDFASADC